MASLVAPHWEAVASGARRLLAALGQLPLLQPFYLGGGTALALRLGHRISRDLDLFADIETLDEGLRRAIVGELHQAHSVNLLQDSPLGLVLDVDGQAVSFFTYGYPLLEPTDRVENIQVAGLVDIGLMKLDAIAGRGMRKDFYDLYFVASRVTLRELFDRGAEEYPESHRFGMRVLTALVDFNVADQEEEPILLQSASWDEVKAFCAAESRRIGREWFGLPGMEGV